MPSVCNRNRSDCKLFMFVKPDNLFHVEFSTFHPRFPAGCYRLMLAFNRSVLDGVHTRITLQKALASISSVRIFQSPFLSDMTQRFCARIVRSVHPASDDTWPVYINNWNACSDLIVDCHILILYTTPALMIDHAALLWKYESLCIISTKKRTMRDFKLPPRSEKCAPLG